MTFNWFDRNADPNKPPAPGTETPTEGAAAENQPPTSEEMLTFAKAAYENLKKQKATEAQAASSESAAESGSAPESDQAVPPTETPTETAQAEAPVFYSPPPDDSGLPFWARAEADREVRLARLRENAIETSVENAAQSSAAEPETITRPPIDPASLVPLDGDFLWSMEVLASQGRTAENVTLEEITWLKQLRQGLDRTRRSLVNQLRAIVGQGPLNEDAVMEIEALLLQADVGVAATDRIIEALQNRLRQEVLPPDKAIAYLKELLINLLEEPLKDQSPVFVPEKDQLNIWLLTGVNGVGKTTTIGKLTHIATKSGYSCLIAAADTFRAAAVEQVKVWGARSGVEVISNPGQNTDPASVVFDAISAAQSRNTELLLVDTAGRLQNKKNLMDELSKVRRIIDKKAPEAKVESLLVLDATLGQNGLQQARVFAEAAQLSGVVLTKLDGTAKGGIALAVVQQLGLPIRFIGAGEGIEDLRPFSSYEFVEALISG